MLTRKVTSLFAASLVVAAAAATSFRTPDVYEVTVTLTNAQIQSLPSSNVQLVASPGENKTLIPVSMVIVTNFVEPYTNLGDYGHLYGDNGLGLVRLVDLLDVTSRRIVAVGLGTSLWSLDNYSHYFQQRSYDQDVNDGIYLNAINHDASFLWLGDFTGGDVSNTLTVTLTYRVYNTVTLEYE